VLKVLGFSPWQLMMLVLGEALLLGGGTSMLSALGTRFVINDLMGGLNFPIAFFSTFMVSTDAVVWGIAFSTGAAFLGSILPALSARNVKVSEVFSKVA
jgi:putative ABC transport system permease protein